MSDATPPPASDAGRAASPDALNDQVRDSVLQLEALLGRQAGPFAQAAAYQTITHAIALGMQNAVAQQQHGHMLRTALTTAAAKALLEGRREEAEAVLKLAESRLVNPDVGAELARLQSTLKTTLEELQKTFASGVSPGPAAESASV
jgi:predicted ATPase